MPFSLAFGGFPMVVGFGMGSGVGLWVALQVLAWIFIFSLHYGLRRCSGLGLQYDGVEMGYSMDGAIHELGGGNGQIYRRSNIFLLLKSIKKFIDLKSKKIYIYKPKILAQQQKLPIGNSKV